MPKRVLVVDDDPLYIELLKNMAEAYACEAVTAPHCAAAIGILESQSIDLIISDIDIPQVNGITFYERVARDERWNTIPFAFLTCLGRRCVVEYLREHPGIRLIEKGDVVKGLRGVFEQLTGVSQTTSQQTANQ